MSKLAFILCVALFASAANASYISDTLTAATAKVESIIDSAIETVKTKFEAAKQKSNEIAEKLQAAALEYSQKIVDQITAILDKAQDEVNKLTGKAEGVDITECTQLAAHLDQTALSVVSNMSTCVVDKIELGAGYIESMIKISNDVLDNLTAMKDEASHCGDNIDGISAGFKAIACTNFIAVRASWAAAKAVPAFSVNVGKLTYLLTILQPSLAYCTTVNGITTFHRESSTIVDRTKKCIQQKIDEVRDAEPETKIEGENYRTPIYTTEEDDYTKVLQLPKEHHHEY